MIQRILGLVPLNLSLYPQSVIISLILRWRASHSESQMDSQLQKDPKSQTVPISITNAITIRLGHHLQSLTRTFIYTCIHALAAHFYSPIAHCLPCQSCLPHPTGNLTACFFGACPSLSISSVYACSHCACIPVSEFRNLHVALT